MKNILLIAMVSVFAVACGKKDKNPFSNAKEAVEEKDLQGKNFESECSTEALDALLTGILSGGQASVKSSRVTYRFEGSNITRTTVLFANLACAGEAFRYSETGTFNVTKNQKTGDGASFIDIKYRALTVKMDSEVGATAANAIKLCGISDWAAGQEARDVTAQSSDATCYGTTLPRDNFNVYRIDAGKTLVMGSGSLENANKRPTTLSASIKYTAN